MIKESDWKKFKKIKASALERFCGTVLGDIEDGLNKTDSSNHEKYLYLYKLIQNHDKQLAQLFDGHSRSKVVIQLMMLRREGWVTDEDIQDMSEELKENTDPNFWNLR